MNHTFVIHIFSCIERRDALRRQLLNRVVKSSQTITTVREWNLRKDDKSEDGDEDFAFHFFRTARLRIATNRRRDTVAPSIFEIHSRHCLDDGMAEFDNRDVVRMDRVGVQHRTVAKDTHEGGIG